MKTRYSIAAPIVLVALCLLLTGALANPLCARADNPLPMPVTHQHFNFLQGPVTQDGDGAVSEANYKNPPSPICSTSSTSSNANIDCEGTAPHNETSLAVNPTNSLNAIGSANDYQLFLSSGGQINETAYSRGHVTFDGGKTWTTYPINYNGYTSTGDPAVAYDASGKGVSGDAWLYMVAGQRLLRESGYPGRQLERRRQDVDRSCPRGVGLRHVHQPRRL